MAITNANATAIAANRAMGDFLSTISHEIRTPLNAVIGMTDLLLDSDLDDGQQELVQTLQTSGELLLQLINDILDLSKIEARKMLIRAEPYSLRKLVNECAAMMESCVIAKGLQFKASVDPQVPDRLVGDGLRLRQIILNLLSNAIKFTQEGEVSLGLLSCTTSSGDEELEIIVEDTGKGISPDFLPCIFEDFMQDTGSVFPSQGTGLGLSICRNLCQLMGGGHQRQQHPWPRESLSGDAAAQARRRTTHRTSASHPAGRRGQRHQTVADSGSRRQPYQPTPAGTDAGQAEPQGGVRGRWPASGGAGGPRRH
ncbi:hypothetical protein KBY97_02590 [Synechococcus sp. ATX 2A4]|uniref:sensor histidine kinase n=1 Tax=Synechococcus sp. ATX 2A4 TaxID=2823727 RepID=UPI0020CCB8FC|nr:ATP-binding protein [Synechococcus sp. ATX 2A4]MCP9884018.1 hypothetical protein [Synechococcus sp. ATX 2A4]